VAAADAERGLLMQLILSVALAAGVVRFGLLLWGGYHNGRVKSAALWSRYHDRRTQPAIFWMFMTVHLLVVVTFTGLIVAIALRLVPISN
jgi:hypothetical protein